MKKIALAFIFITLELYIRIGNSVVHLIPEFVGYILFYIGCREMRDYSESFSKVMPASLAMSVVYGVSFVMDLIAVSASLGFFGVLLGFVLTGIFYYITYQIIMGITEIEYARQCFLNSDMLMKMWRALLFIDIASSLLIWIPFVNFLVIPMTFVKFACSVAFIYHIYRAQSLFETGIPPQNMA